MSKIVLRALIALVVIPGLSGCIVVSKSVNQPTPAVVIPEDAEGQIALIDAYTQLSFDRDRTQGLLSLASNTHLHPTAQTHLIQAAMKLSFDQSRVAVLSKLGRNPSLTPQARQLMLQRIDHLGFDQNRKTIIDILARNPGKQKAVSNPYSTAAPTDHSALINYYAKVSSDTDKTNGLTALAQREDLDVASRQLLVETALTKVSSHDGRTRILVALASNPTVSGPTLEHLVNAAPRIGSANNERQVIEALTNRPASYLPAATP